MFYAIRNNWVLKVRSEFEQLPTWAWVLPEKILEWGKNQMVRAYNSIGTLEKYVKGNITYP